MEFVDVIGRRAEIEQRDERSEVECHLILSSDIVSYREVEAFRIAECLLEVGRKVGEIEFGNESYGAEEVFSQIIRFDFYFEV